MCASCCQALVHQDDSTAISHFFRSGVRSHPINWDQRRSSTAKSELLGYWRTALSFFMSLVGGEANFVRTLPTVEGGAQQEPWEMLHVTTGYLCGLCSSAFSATRNLRAHYRDQHSEAAVPSADACRDAQAFIQRLHPSAKAFQVGII
jgi:hypothetical protein